MLKKSSGICEKVKEMKVSGELVRQFLVFAFNGISHNISRFDELKNDPGYAGATKEPLATLKALQLNHF